jgi:hypothetical protein
VCCFIFEVVGVKQYCVGKPIPVIVLHLPNPRSSALRACEYLLMKAEEFGQDQHPLLFVDGDINGLFHQQLHPYLVIIVHCTKPPTTCGRGEQPRMTVGPVAPSDVPTEQRRLMAKHGGGACGTGDSGWAGGRQTRGDECDDGDGYPRG